MKFKEFLLINIQLYFVLVTLITAASMIVGVIFLPEQTIKYYQLAGPFIISALCILPSFITYFRGEPTLKQFILRHIIQLILIEGIVLFFIRPPENTDSLLFSIMIGAIVLVIYVLAKFTAWFRKYRQSLKFTEQLRKLQTSE